MPQDRGLQTAPGDRGAVQRAVRRRRVPGGVSEPPQVFLHALVHRVSDFWRSQGYDALHHQQEQFENAVQEHRRAAYEQVETAAAHASSRAAAHMTSRLKEIENKVEANFSHQQRRLFTEIPSQPKHSKLSQHILVRKVTNRNDAAETLSLLRSELRFHRLQAEDQSNEFQHSQEESTENVEWSNTERAQFKSLHEETSWCTRRSRLRAREAQLVTEVFERGVTNTLPQSPPKECSGQCSYGSHSDYKQFDGYMAQGIDAAVRRPIPKSVIPKLMALICGIRWEEANLPKVETQKLFEIPGARIIP